MQEKQLAEAEEQAFIFERCARARKEQIIDQKNIISGLEMQILKLKSELADRDAEDVKLTQIIWRNLESLRECYLGIHGSLEEPVFETFRKAFENTTGV
jgi:hypothetical protein